MGCCGWRRGQRESRRGIITCWWPECIHARGCPGPRVCATAGGLWLWWTFFYTCLAVVAGTVETPASAAGVFCARRLADVLAAGVRRTPSLAARLSAERQVVPLGVNQRRRPRISELCSPGGALQPRMPRYSQRGQRPEAAETGGGGALGSLGSSGGCC